MALTIELLDSKKHNRSVFSCGNDNLDNYLRRQASQDLKKKVATVFILIDSPNVDIIAYYLMGRRNRLKSFVCKACNVLW